MIKYMKRKYWWPSMNKDIKDYCQSCWTCAITDHHQGKPLSVPQYSTKSLFDTISFDLITGLTKTRRGNKNILVIIDHASRFMKAIPIHNKRESTIAKALWQHWIANFGFPRKVVSDQGSEFVNKVMRALLKRNGIDQDLMAAYYHRSNGLVERANRTLLALLRKSITSLGEQWDNGIDGTVLAYNTSLHTSLGASPFFLMYGQDPHNIADYLLGIQDEPPHGLPEPQAVFERLSSWWERKMAEELPGRAIEKEPTELLFRQGDLILIPRRYWPAKSKTWTRWTGPHEVISQPSRTEVIVRNAFTGRKNSVHINEVYPLPEMKNRCQPGWRLIQLLEKEGIESHRCFLPTYHELLTLPEDPSSLRDYDAIMVPRCCGSSWSREKRKQYRVVKIKASRALLKDNYILQDYGTHDWELWINPSFSSSNLPTHSDLEIINNSEVSSVEGCKDVDEVTPQDQPRRSRRLQEAHS